MSRLLTRAAVLYLIALLVVVGYGLKGYSFPAQDGIGADIAALPVYQDYRQYLSWSSKGLGLYLGLLTAVFGLWAGAGNLGVDSFTSGVRRISVQSTLLSGLGALILGVLVSAAAMLPLHHVVVPGDSYQPWLLWIVSPYWIATWAIITFPGLLISRLRSKGA